MQNSNRYYDEERIELPKGTTFKVEIAAEGKSVLMIDRPETTEMKNGFNDGDILVGSPGGSILIYKKREDLEPNYIGYYACLPPEGEVITQFGAIYPGKVPYRIKYKRAAEEEKNKIYEALKKKVLEWSPEEKCLKAWTPKQGEAAYVINSYGGVDRVILKGYGEGYRRYLVSLKCYPTLEIAKYWAMKGMKI